jgi:hypothetical protein
MMIHRADSNAFNARETRAILQQRRPVERSRAIQIWVIRRCSGIRRVPPSRWSKGGKRDVCASSRIKTTRMQSSLAARMWGSFLSRPCVSNNKSQTPQPSTEIASHEQPFTIRTTMSSKTSPAEEQRWHQQLHHMLSIRVSWEGWHAFKWLWVFVLFESLSFSEIISLPNNHRNMIFPTGPNSWNRPGSGPHISTQRSWFTWKQILWMQKFTILWRVLCKMQRDHVRAG